MCTQIPGGNHAQQVDDKPVVAGEAADDSGARIEEKTRKRKRFWRWVAL